mgnify:CR=1 FL=1
MSEELNQNGPLNEMIYDGNNLLRRDFIMWPPRAGKGLGPKMGRFEKASKGFKSPGEAFEEGRDEAKVAFISVRL